MNWVSATTSPGYYFWLLDIIRINCQEQTSPKMTSVTGAEMENIILVKCIVRIEGR
jgi:hypothetical protein